MVVTGLLRQTIDGVEFHIAVSHRPEAFSHIALKSQHTDGHQRTVDIEIAPFDAVQRSLEITVEGQLTDIQHIGIALAEVGVAHTLQVLILVVAGIELISIAGEEMNITLQSHRHAVILHIILLLGQ